MISIIEQTLSFDGLVWLIIAVIFAGLVRGFVGFGTALIFMPIAASVTSPISVSYTHLTLPTKRIV